jgi:hypothetical protein
MDGQPEWQEVPVKEPLAFAKVGELYQALADRENIPGVLTGFDGF